VALPLNVAKCQEMPNRFRQWLSEANSSDKAGASPRESRALKARNHCSAVPAAVSSADGVSLSSIVLS
jgi:hypothetical protein